MSFLQLELVIPTGHPQGSWSSLANDPDLPSFFSHFKTLCIEVPNVNGPQYVLTQTILSTILSMTPNLDTLRILQVLETQHGAFTVHHDGTAPKPPPPCALQQRRSYSPLDGEEQTIDMTNLAETVYRCLKARDTAATLNGTLRPLKSLRIWQTSPEKGLSSSPDPSVVEQLKTLVQDVQVVESLSDLLAPSD